MKSFDIRKTFAELEFVNCSNPEFNTLPAEEVKQIVPVIDKDGKAHLMVNYYDDEFCVTSTLVCDFLNIKEREL